MFLLNMQKYSPEDILLKITVFNRGPEAAPLHVLPNIWFRNTWDWGYSSDKPSMERMTDNSIIHSTQDPGKTHCYMQKIPGSYFFVKMKATVKNFIQYHSNKDRCYFKDGINDYIIHGANTVNPGQSGTKAAFHFNKTIDAGKSETFQDPVESRSHLEKPFEDFEKHI